MQSPYVYASTLDADMLTQKLSRYAHEPNPRFSEEEIMGVIQATYLQAQSSLTEWRRVYLSPSPTPRSRLPNSGDAADADLKISPRAANTPKTPKTDRNRYCLRPRPAKTQTFAKTQKPPKIEKPIQKQKSKKAQKPIKVSRLVQHKYPLRSNMTLS